MKHIMKVFLIVSLAIGLFGCSDVPSGHVGVKVYKLGGSKGVDTEELGPGRYWIGINEDLFIFPTFTQTDTWEGNQQVQFQTKDGMVVSAPIGISYHIDPTKVSIVFQKYRKGIEEISDVYLRNMVRDSLNDVGSKKDIESVYGVGKAEIIEAVQTKVTNQVKDIGIVVEKIYLVGQMEPPANVKQAINLKIEATQKTAQRENEVAQSKAEADKKIEEARGEAESKLLVAKAEAESIKLKGDALKDNPKLADLSAIEKWDGHLPVYSMGNSTPFVNIPTSK